MRIKWIDLAKGITIILMVIGHTGASPVITNWIYSFHMPLFFILSGYTTDWTKYNFSRLVQRKTRGIMRPFVWYSLIMCLLIWAFNIEHPYSSLENGWGAYALWFIPVLYIASLVGGGFLIVLGVRRNNWYLLLVLPIASYLLCFFDIRLPWNMSVVPYATMFIVLGAGLRNVSDKIVTMKLKWLLFIGFLSFAITILVSHFWRLDMNSNRILPIVPLTFAAILGTFLISLISIFTEKYFQFFSKTLQNIGRETFLILAFSQITIQILNKYLTVNVITKYILLIVILMMLKYLKDGVLCIYKWLSEK